MSHPLLKRHITARYGSIPHVGGHLCRISGIGALGNCASSNSNALCTGIKSCVFGSNVPSQGRSQAPKPKEPRARPVFPA